MTDTQRTPPVDPRLLRRAVPSLTVRDLGEAEAFYARLGFTVSSRYEDFLILLAGDVELHLGEWHEHDPDRTDGGFYLRVDDADAVYGPLRAGLERDGVLYLAPADGLTPAHTADLRARRAAGERLVRLHEIADKPWGTREFTVIDPGGNGVRVGHVLPA